MSAPEELVDHLARKLYDRDPEIDDRDEHVYDFNSTSAGAKRNEAIALAEFMVEQFQIREDTDKTGRTFHLIYGMQEPRRRFVLTSPWIEVDE